MAQQELRVARPRPTSSIFGKKAALMVVVVLCAIAAFAAGRAAWRAKLIADRILDFHLAFQDALEVKNLWQEEKWEPENFFSDPGMRQACYAISSRDTDALRREIAMLDDIHRAGASGVTLLHWALFDDNLDAFQLLLEEGADPDAKLTEFIKRARRQPLNQGDSVLFSAIHLKKFDFFYPALEHSSDVHQTDLWGRSLLIAATNSSSIYSIDPVFVSRLAEKGIDLDQRDRYGGTAAYRAIEWGRPDLCLAILQAGADPTIRTEQGEDVADRLAIQMARGPKLQGPPSQVSQAYDDLQAWLEAR